MLQGDHSERTVDARGLIEFLNQLFHGDHRLAPTDQEQCIGGSQRCHSNSPLASSHELFLGGLDQLGNCARVHILKWDDFDFRTGQSARLVQPFDDFRQVCELLVSPTQNYRIEFWQHFDLHPFELGQRQHRGWFILGIFILAASRIRSSGVVRGLQSGWLCRSRRSAPSEEFCLIAHPRCQSDLSIAIDFVGSVARLSLSCASRLKKVRDARAGTRGNTSTIGTVFRSRCFRSLRKYRPRCLAIVVERYDAYRRFAVGLTNLRCQHRDVGR